MLRVYVDTERLTITAPYGQTFTLRKSAALRLARAIMKEMR